MRTMSGLILDVYDDFNGTVLRALYPDFEGIPSQVKEAHVVTADESQRLPDDVYALVLVNSGEKMRKFACIDEGNTLLSIGYFLQTAHKLPEEAQKVAAANLKVACSWYDLDVPEELEKMAGGLSTALTLMAAPSVIKGTHQTISENLSANRALTSSGADLVTPHMRDQALGRKTAEVTGTALAPLQPPGTLGTAPSSKAVIPKTAAIGRLRGATPPDVVHPPTKEQPDKLPQARQMHPTVDVSNAESTRMLKEKKATLFALPQEGKYPLDSYAQVKKAGEYFDVYVNHMEPAVRREYAANLVKRAADLSLPMSDIARKYGSDDFAPEHEIKAAFDARRTEIQHDTDNLALLGDVEKVARFRMWKEASAETPRSFTAAEVVSILAEFDKRAGLDHHYGRTIPDPYYSIYGFEKDASADFSEVIGNETVTAADLTRVARIGAASIKVTFGSDFQEEFLKDPIGIFKSLPLDQKKMMMRIANSSQPGVERTYF